MLYSKAIGCLWRCDFHPGSSGEPVPWAPWASRAWFLAPKSKVKIVFWQSQLSKIRLWRSDLSKNAKSKSKCPKVQKSKIPKVPKSTSRKVHKSKSHKVNKSKSPKVQKSKSQRKNIGESEENHGFS